MTKHPLELRLKRLNRISNASLDNIKRFHEGSSIWKRYVDGVLTLEIYVSVGTCTSTDYFVGIVVKRPPNAAFGKACCLPSAIDGYQMPMLVRVGNLSQGFRPCASVVRLQQLDVPDVLVAQSSQISFRPRIKTAITVFNVGLNILDDELSASLVTSRILDCKFVDEIIESSAQVVDAFTSKDGEVFGDTNEGLILDTTSKSLPRCAQQFRGRKLVLGEEFVLISFPKSLNDNVHLMNVNIGPAESSVSTI